MSNPAISLTAANLAAGQQSTPAAADRQLHDLLKRCPPETLAAARRFRRTREPGLIGPIVLGVITRYVDRDNTSRLSNAAPTLRLREDLGLDSLTLIEMAMSLEDVLQIPLSDDGLRTLRTLGDINRHVAATLKA